MEDAGAREQPSVLTLNSNRRVERHTSEVPQILAPGTGFQEDGFSMD